VLHVLRDHQLYAKYNKCDFFQKEIQYLGHTISTEGVAVDPEKIKAIMDWPFHWNMTEVRPFMGLVGYYIRFFKTFSKIGHPITSLQRKGKKFVWSAECETNFQQLKHLLTNALVLNITDPEKHFLICTDACNEGLK
jgi:hypothetical protein